MSGSSPVSSIFPELVAAATAINNRVLESERAGQGCAIGSALFECIHQPDVWEGQRTGAFRFGDPRARPWPAPSPLCSNTVDGFTNKSLRGLVAGMLGVDYNTNQMSYDLRRLRLHGIIRRISHSNTYTLTREGQRIAIFYTKLADRLLRPLLEAIEALSYAHNESARRLRAGSSRIIGSVVLDISNQMFAHYGLPVRWEQEEYGRLLGTSGGKERLRSRLSSQFVTAAGLPEDPAGQDEVIAAWHQYKTEIYTGMVAAGRLPGRPGVRRIAADAHRAGWTLAVASTSTEASVRAVLIAVVGAQLAANFTVFAGDIVAHKKPAPDVYDLAIRELGADRARTLVIEDSHNGLAAASSAGLPALVTMSSYTVNDDFSGAAMVLTSLGDPGGEEAVVVANRTAARPGRVIGLSDLFD